MLKRHKAYLIFSIIFWMLVVGSLILFGFAFGKVHINKFGILRNYYNSWIDDKVYISGTYHVGVGNYFIQFPSSKIYLSDLKLNVTNSDMNVVQVTYSLVYRLKKDSLIYLYQNMSTNYEDRIVATVNGIISNYFFTLTQEQTRVTVQNDLIFLMQKFGQKMAVLKNAVQLQAIWINQIDFLSKESQYNSAYLDAGTFSEAYESMEIQTLLTNMKVQTMQNLIEDLRNNLTLTSDYALRNATLTSIATAEYENARKKILLSQNKSAQIFQFYRPLQIKLQ